MNILLLHGYSARNAGDGLLVEESLQLIREAFGVAAKVTLVARDPESFSHINVNVVDARLLNWRAGLTYLRILRRMDDYNAVVAVGGGYLRFGTPVEAAKTAIAHLPQVFGASRATCPTFYLPQSIGPLGWGFRPVLRSMLARQDVVFLRDDRSVGDVDLPNAVRVPDLALLSPDWTEASTVVDNIPVLSVRRVGGDASARLRQLAQLMRPFDGYVQSRGRGNDDEAAVRETGPRAILRRTDLLSDEGPRRVVVAVRLHAALMALRAGHLVVHLAYERKGFGAFHDLGLAQYVHNVNSFDASRVRAQVAGLLGDPSAQVAYREAVSTARARFSRERASVVTRIRSTLSQRS